MKKVCMVVPSFTAKGGIAAVVSGYRNSELEKKYNIKYIESYCDGGKANKTLKAIIAYFIFIKEIIFNKPDLVHVHSSFGASFYRKLPFVYIANIFRIPVVNHIHGADFNDFYLNASDKKKKFIRKVYNKCLYIVVLSQEWKEKIELLLDEKKIVIIENYGTLNEKAILERNIKSNEYKILFLGFICKRKGCYDIPAVVKKVSEKVPNIKFILAGTGEVEEIKKIIPNTIQKNIIFPGWIRNKEKDRLLKEADIFFLPSYNEGMPMAILDAMGYGLPIISTTVGGISKIVLNGKNGFLFEPGDIDGFSNSLIELLLDNDKRKSFERVSVNIIKDSYSLEKHIKKLYLLYERML